MIKAFLLCIITTVLVSASTPARCGPLFGNQKCPCVGTGKPWDMNTYCDEIKGECGKYRSSHDASSGFYDCETNVVESLPTGCLKIENGNFAGIYKVSGLHAGKNRYVHTTDASKVISWVQIGRYAWHITQNGQGVMHWYHDRDAYGINIGFDGNPAAGRIPGIPDLSGFPEVLSDYESQAEGCMPAVTRPTKPCPSITNTLECDNVANSGACRYYSNIRNEYPHCSAFCEDNGMTCVGMYDDSGNTCAHKTTHECDYTGQNDNDWICECAPQEAPTSNPTSTPTQTPTSNPTLTPTRAPTSNPTQTPTSNPTLTPTRAPTSTPTLTPTSAPSLTPTKSPSPAPTAQEFDMKIKGFHGNPVSSLARIVFSQERTEVEKIVSDAKTIKAAKDTTRKN